MELMELIRNGGAALFSGLYDSFKGVVILFVLDRELKRRREARLSSPTHSNSPVRRRQSEQNETTPVRVLGKHKKETTVLKRISYCAILNGAIFLTSILFFEYAFLPFMRLSILFVFGKDADGSGQSIWLWIEVILRITFQSIWVVPIFALTKFVNNLWFQDISQSAYKYSRGRPTASLGLSKTVADFIFSTVVETLFLVQAIFMTFIPIYYIGQIAYLVHLSLLYSLYAFEYKWGEMGWVIHKRLTCIELHHTYFFGFGLPLALCSQVTDNFIINGCIFSMLFPLFIISANEAEPKSDSRTPIPIFSLVITLSNIIFNVLMKENKPIQKPTTRFRR